MGAAEHQAFLRTYDQIDIALDTFPYNGGTTTTEALWQGVPVLSFNGDRWAARTSRSLLLAAGLDDWVAADETDYIRHCDPPVPPARTRRLNCRSCATACGRGWRRVPRANTATLCRSLEALYQS